MRPTGLDLSEPDELLAGPMKVGCAAGRHLFLRHPPSSAKVDLVGRSK
jgi:hypothetical protein